MADLKEEIEKLGWAQLQKVLALYEKESEKRIKNFIDDAGITLQEYEQDAEKNVATFNKLATDTVEAHNKLVKRIDEITEGKLPTKDEIQHYISDDLLKWSQTNLEKYQKLADQIQEAFKRMDEKIDRYRTGQFNSLFISMLHTFRIYLKLFPLAEGVEVTWKMVPMEDFERLKKAGWILFATDGATNVLVAQIFKDGKVQVGIHDFVDTFKGTELIPDSMIFPRSLAKIRSQAHAVDDKVPEMPVDPKKEEAFALNEARAVLKSDKIGFLDENNRLTQKGKDFLDKIPDEA